MISFKKKLNNKAFSHVELLLLLIVVIGVSGVGYYVYKHGNSSHATTTYTNVGSISYDGQTFSAQACITAQTGTSPNEIDTISALITANTEVGASATISVTQPSAVATDQNVVTADQTALTDAQDAIIDAQSVSAAQEAAIQSASSALAAAKAKLAAAEVSGPTHTIVTFNPSAYYTINGTSPVAEDGWSTGASSTIYFDLPPTAQTSDFSLGVEGPAAGSGSTGNISVGSIALCNVTPSGPSQLTLDEATVTADLNALNAAKAAIVDEQSPTAAQEATITADNAAWIAAKDKVILDEGGTVTSTTPTKTTTTTTPTKTTTTTTPTKTTTTTTPTKTTTTTSSAKTTTSGVSANNAVTAVKDGNAQSAENAINAVKEAAGAKKVVVKTEKGSVQIYSAIPITTFQEAAAKAATSAVPNRSGLTTLVDTLKNILHIHTKKFITVSIPFTTKYVVNKTLPAKSYITTTIGVNGVELEQITNGKLALVSIITAPVQQVVEVSTPYNSGQ